MALHTIEIEGRLFEDAVTLKGRIGIAEMTLWRAVREDDMPAPIKNRCEALLRAQGSRPVAT